MNSPDARLDDPADWCRVCDGTGWDDEGDAWCPECDGTGYTAAARRSDAAIAEMEIENEWDAERADQ